MGALISKSMKVSALCLWLLSGAFPAKERGKSVGDLQAFSSLWNTGRDIRILQSAWSLGVPGVGLHHSSPERLTSRDPHSLCACLGLEAARLECSVRKSYSVSAVQWIPHWQIIIAAQNVPTSAPVFTLHNIWAPATCQVGVEALGLQSWNGQVAFKEFQLSLGNRHKHLNIIK